MIKIDKPSCPNPSALTTNYKHPDNKSALESASFSKCIYCESKVTTTYFGDVEHLKPKSLFPALEFDWDNLGFVCAKCNNAKSNKHDSSCEHINPYLETPEDYVVAVHSLLYCKKGSERGEKTIIDIDLNRLELIERRKEKIDTVQKAINACYRTLNTQLRDYALTELKNECNSDKEYSLFIKHFLAIHNI